jgi:hypothetical protein
VLWHGRPPLLIEPELAGTRIGKDERFYQVLSPKLFLPIIGMQHCQEPYIHR